MIAFGFCMGLFFAGGSQLLAAPILGAAPTLTGGTFIDFEGQAEGDATNLYAGLGVTFYNGGSFPVIDNSPFTFGYTSNSGVGVLSLNAAPAQLGMNFTSGKSAVEFFFSDTAVLGDYVISAFANGGGLLESFVVSAATAGSSPLYLGFNRAAADIFEVRILPNNGSDAFAIDDLRFSAVPEPSSFVLLGLGALGLVAFRRKRHNAKQ